MVNLMEMLIAEGYPESEMYHHESDLYIYVTPLTQAVVNVWCKINNYHRSQFVSTFYDQQTGKLMYDIAFQYTPYWNEKAGE